MKKIVLTFISLLFLTTLNNAFASTPSDYFVGNWNVVVTGTPSGDAEMIIHLERLDGKLQGRVKNEGENEGTKIDKIDEKDTSITIYYSAMGYDVYLSFDKVDDNNIKGSMMGMFNSTGKRVVK